jgi:hypothetical protein
MYGTDRSAAIYKELGELTQNPEIQEALAARAFVSQQNLEKLDEAFKMIGEKPVEFSSTMSSLRISAGSLGKSNHQKPNGFSFWRRLITSIICVRQNT